MTPPARRLGSRSCALASAVVVAAVLAAGRARAATVVDLGALVPSAVNEQDVVVGDIVDPNDPNAVTHAGRWANGTLTPLPERAGTTDSEAFAIGGTGRIAGLEHSQSADEVHAVYWDGVATPTQLGPLFAVPNDFSQASDVDAAGDVVGTSLAEHASYGFYAAGGGSPVAVGTADVDPDGGSTFVGAISGDGKTLLGQVNGTAANDGYYLWSSASPDAPGVALDLTPDRSGFGLLAGSVYAALLIQNDLASDGAVFGYKGAGASRTWWLRLANGTETQIVGLTAHNAINGKHLVAGTVVTGDPTDPVHAAIWDAATQQVTDLNTLLPPGSGFDLFDATAINDAGDVVGMAAHKGMAVGFLLKRTPLTATIAPTPPDPVVGTTFTLTISVTNGGGSAVTNVTPPAALTVSGDGKGTQKSGPTPAAVATLAAGDTATFTYMYEATDPGSIRFTADVGASSVGGPVTVTARCGLATSGERAARAAGGGSCPADGNGTIVQVETCTVALLPYTLSSHSDVFTFAKRGPDSMPAAGHGYPSGGT